MIGTNGAMFPGKDEQERFQARHETRTPPVLAPEAQGKCSRLRGREETEDPHRQQNQMLFDGNIKSHDFAIGGQKKPDAQEVLGKGCEPLPGGKPEKEQAGAEPKEIQDCLL